MCVNTQHELEMIQQFPKDTNNLSTAERAFPSSIETIQANIRWMNTIGQDTGAWLDNSIRRIL